LIIIEGIHALNPVLTKDVNDKIKYKIYVSALSQVNIDNINRIPTRDTRLIRRIVRDVHFRGIQASENLKRWKDVIAAEEKYIFPYQENADVMFNSALIYELPILRNFAEVPLRAIEYKEKEYAEALRLLNFLNHVLPLSSDEVPPTSILREFIGKSSFKY
jgi:uridine kinase